MLPITRYMSVDPEQLKTSARNIKVVFDPNEKNASLWQCEMLKSDSKIAKYVILHRFWSWLRNSTKKEG